MSIKVLITQILGKMPEIHKWSYNFMVYLFRLLGAIILKIYFVMVIIMRLLTVVGILLFLIFVDSITF